MSGSKPEGAVIVIDRKEAASASVENIIKLAIEKNMPPESLEKFMVMRRELRAEAAKEEYDNAMAGFQSECPVIEKKTDGGKTKGGGVAYKYAPLGDIVEQVKGLLEKYGFSYSFLTTNSPTEVEVTCIVKHRAGHSEQSIMKTSMGSKTEIMSVPQQVAATVTFDKRYAFCNAFGIVTKSEDNEDDLPPPPRPLAATQSAPAPAKPPIPEAPKESETDRLVRLLNEYKMPKEAFETQCGKFVHELAPDNARKLADALEAKIKAGETYKPKTEPETPAAKTQVDWLILAAKCATEAEAKDLIARMQVENETKPKIDAVTATLRLRFQNL